MKTLKKSLPSASSPSEGQTSVTQRPLTILLAEDTPANQKVVKRVLCERGHEVTVVSNGREALDQIAIATFDAVLMDVQMPVMDGYQATATIRKLEGSSGAHMPIIALTANSSDSDRTACLEAGMDAYVSKPINIDELIATLESVSNPSQRSPASAAPSDDSFDDNPEEGIIDLADTMKRLGGDQQLLKRFVEVFDEDAPRLLETLRSAVAEHDSPTTMRAAHSLRGLAANFGAARVVELASLLEESAKQDELQDTDALLDQLADAVEQLSTIVKPYGPSS